MNDDFKKICVCGALAITVYGFTPLCMDCLGERHTDLPRDSYVTAMRSIYVSSISGTTTTITHFIV